MNLAIDDLEVIVSIHEEILWPQDYHDSDHDPYRQEKVTRTWNIGDTRVGKFERFFL